MARRRSFFLNLFLQTVGVSETRPAWFVMLLAAMATAAVWAGVWVAAFGLMQATSAWTSEKLPPLMLIGTFLLFWAVAVPWYHLVYLWGLRRERAGAGTDATETRWEVWGSLFFMIILAVVKVTWFFLKYAAAPFIPLIVADELRAIPVVGEAVSRIAIVLVAAYPLIALAVYAIWRHRTHGRVRQSTAADA